MRRFDLDSIQGCEEALQAALNTRDREAVGIIGRRLMELRGRPLAPARSAGGGSLLPGLQRIRGMIADARRLASEIDQQRIRDVLNGTAPTRPRPVASDPFDDGLNDVFGDEEWDF